MTVPGPAAAINPHGDEAEGAARAIRHTVLTGLLFGVTGVYLAAIGLLQMLRERAIIVGVMSLGHATLLAIGLAAGLVAARGAGASPSGCRAGCWPGPSRALWWRCCPSS